MLVVAGKICPQCGWDGGASLDEAIVYLKCLSVILSGSMKRPGLETGNGIVNHRIFGRVLGAVPIVAGKVNFTSSSAWTGVLSS